MPLVIVKLLLEVTALLVLWRWESVVPLFTGRERKPRVQHMARNLVMGLLNVTLVSLCLSALMFHVVRWSAQEAFGLLRWMALPAPVAWVVAFLLFDAYMYGWHRCNHRIPFLWRFHRVHHTDTALDASSALRFHPGEILLSTLLRLAVVPVLGLSFTQLMCYEMCLQPVILFHHSNVKLTDRLDCWLRAVFVSPNMHRVHHSQIPAETDANYSSMFSWWDRIFRTLRLRPDLTAISYGLAEFKDAHWQGVWGMLRTPVAASQQTHL